jgi:hypothetical protein
MWARCNSQCCMQRGCCMSCVTCNLTCCMSPVVCCTWCAAWHAATSVGSPHGVVDHVDHRQEHLSHASNATCHDGSLSFALPRYSRSALLLTISYSAFATLRAVPWLAPL